MLEGKIEGAGKGTERGRGHLEEEDEEGGQLDREKVREGSLLPACFATPCPLLSRCGHPRRGSG